MSKKGGLTVKVILCGQDGEGLRRAYKVLARAALERPLRPARRRKRCARQSTSG